MQYCRVCKHWKPETEFHDERKGYHGNRTWCRVCASKYNKKRLAAKKRQLRKLIRFWNKYHKKQIPLPK